MQAAFCSSCGADRRGLELRDPCLQCGAQVMIAGAPEPMSRYPATQPRRGTCITGGVLSIIVSVVITFVFFAAASSMEEMNLPREGTAAVGVVFAVMGIAGVIGIVAGAMTCAAKPAWTLTSAILMTVWAVLFLLAVVGGQVASLFFVVLGGLAALFCFRGVRQARAWQEYKSMKHMPDVF